MCANRTIKKEEFVGTTTLARNLRLLRKEAGYSQDAIAKRIHKTQLTIHKWEAGKTEPRPTNLRELLDIYEMELGRHITIDEVLGR